MHRSASDEVASFASLTFSKNRTLRSGELPTQLPSSVLRVPKLISVFVVQSCGRRRKRRSLLTLSLLTFSADGPHQPRSGRHLLPLVCIIHADESPLSPFLAWKSQQIHPLSLIDPIIRHCEFAHTVRAFALGQRLSSIIQDCLTLLSIFCA